MSMEDVKNFYQEILKNEKLREELEEEDIRFRNELEYESDFNSYEVDEDYVINFFEDNFIPIANKYGYDFSVYDVIEYERCKENELDKHSLDLLYAGRDLGYDICIIYGIGQTNVGDKICLSLGSSINPNNL